MISFGEFFDILDSEKQLTECAKLISYSSHEPKEIVESVLEDDILESWKSWLGKAGSAASQVASGVVSGAVAGGTKVAQGVRQANDTMSGPAAKFQNAIETLKDLEKMLRSNPATKGIASKSAPKRSIAGYIQAIYQALEKERSSMPQMVGDKYLRGSQIEKEQGAMNPQSQGAGQEGGGQSQDAHQGYDGNWARKQSTNMRLAQ